MPSVFASRPRKSMKCKPLSRRRCSNARSLGGAASARSLSSAEITPSSFMRPSGYEGAVGLRRDDPALPAMRLETVFLSVRPIVESLARSTMPSSTTLLSSRRKRPAGAPLRRLGARQGDQLGFLLAVENRSNGRCHAPFAAQHRFEALFHQLLAYPVDHGRTGVQGLDDPAVASAFACLRDIGLQQNARLQQPLRRALSFADQRLQMLASPALNRSRTYRARQHDHRRGLREVIDIDDKERRAS
jgi:hypothetical protein